MLAQSSSQLRSAPVKVALPLTTSCALTWRDRKLFVRAASPAESLNLEALQDSDRLVECLRRSPVELVKLDSDLSPEVLLRWAEACGKAKKACYINVPSVSEILSQPNPILWFVKKSIHRVTAIVLALAMMPVLFVTMTVFKMVDLRLQRQWAIGDRGRLLQLWVYEQPIDRSSGFFALRSFLLKLVNVIQGNLLLGTPMPTALEQG